MTEILAQADVGTLPAPWLKSAIVWSVALIIVASFFSSALFAGLQYLLDRRVISRAQKRLIEGPVETVEGQKFVTDEICRSRFHANKQRLETAEKNISDLWFEMRKEDTATRNQLTQATNDFERALGQLEGTLKQVNETMRAILQKELGK